MKILVQFVCSLAVVTLAMMTCDIAKAGDGHKKILFFSKSSGYEQDMVRRAKSQPSAAERILVELGKKNNFDFTFSKDGSIFTSEIIGKFDAFCFFTSGDSTQLGDDHNPPISREGKAAFLEAIHNGKGFVGIYSAIDTFHSSEQGVDPYTKMIGGQFLNRNEQEPAHQIVVDKSFPGMGAVPDNFRPVEDWYVLKNFSTNLHVLLVQDTASMGRAAYNRPNYPSTWAQRYGKGRVFYTGMGQREGIRAFGGAGLCPPQKKIKLR
jgi:type 1 glutamine amidotransferase